MTPSPRVPGDPVRDVASPDSSHGHAPVDFRTVRLKRNEVRSAEFTCQQGTGEVPAIQAGLRPPRLGARAEIAAPAQHFRLRLAQVLLEQSQPGRCERTALYRLFCRAESRAEQTDRPVAGYGRPPVPIDLAKMGPPVTCRSQKSDWLESRRLPTTTSTPPRSRRPTTHGSKVRSWSFRREATRTGSTGTGAARSIAPRRTITPRRAPLCAPQCKWRTPPRGDRIPSPETNRGTR